MSRRSMLAFGLALAGVLALPGHGNAAEECGFAGFRNLDEARQRNATLAVLTRVDPGGGSTPKFRVERSLGGGAPVGEIVGLGCDPHVPVGRVFGMLRTADGLWLGLSPHLDDLGVMQSLIEGEPTQSAGRAVAVAVGEYGRSRLVAFDAAGRAVAWNSRPSAWPHLVAACPGGRTVVTVGAGGPGYPDYDYEFAVYDVEGLRLRRSVATPPTGFGIVAFRCLDAEGHVAQTLTSGYALNSGTSTLRTFDGPRYRETSVPLVDLSGAVALPDGFLVPRPEGPTLIDSDGRVRRLPKGELPDRLYRLRVAPDGRTVAATTEGSFDANGGKRIPSEVLVFDLSTGKVLGRWTPPTYVDGLAWTSSGRLMVRIGYSDGRAQPQNLGRVVFFDRSMQGVGELSGAAGVEFGALGENALYWGDAPIGIVGAGRSRPTTGDLRLAATRDVIALSSGTFEPAGAAPSGTLPPLGSAEPSTNRTSVGIAIAVAVAALTAGAWRAASRRRAP